MRKTIEHLISYLILGLGTCDIQIGKNVPLSSHNNLCLCAFRLPQMALNADLTYSSTSHVNPPSSSKKHAIENMGWISKSKCFIFGSN